MALIKAVYYGCFNSFHTKKIAMHGPHAMSYKLRGEMGVHHAVQLINLFWSQKRGKATIKKQAKSNPKN